MPPDTRPPRDWELVYVSDPSNVCNYDFDPGDARPLITSHPAAPEELRTFIDRVATSTADVFVQEVYNAGWTMYFRSERFEYDARPQHRRFLPMMDDGIMPLRVMLERCRERGMRCLAGFRVNDNHGAPDQGGMFLHRNPQWKITDVPPGGAFLPGNRMDFTVPEVRDYLYAVVAEVVSRFDVDGVLLTFRDGLYFPAPGGDRSLARERQPLMTGLIERLRAMLDEHGAARGRRLELGVLVPETLEDCHGVGLDVPAWIGGRLVDFVAPMDSAFTNFNADYEEFRALTAETPCRLYPGVQPYCSSRESFGPPASAENYRALAHALRQQGADGMSVYNFQKHWGGFRSGQARRRDRLADGLPPAARGWRPAAGCRRRPSLHLSLDVGRLPRHQPLRHQRLRDDEGPRSWSCRASRAVRRRATGSGCSRRWRKTASRHAVPARRRPGIGRPDRRPPQRHRGSRRVSSAACTTARGARRRRDGPCRPTPPSSSIWPPAWWCAATTISPSRCCSPGWWTWARCRTPTRSSSTRRT